MVHQSRRWPSGDHVTAWYLVAIGVAHLSRRQRDLRETRDASSHAKAAGALRAVRAALKLGEVLRQQLVNLAAQIDRVVPSLARHVARHVASQQGLKQGDK